MGSKFDRVIYLILLLQISGSLSSLPDSIELPPNEFLPGPVKYFTNNYNEEKNQATESAKTSNADKPQEPRLGYINNSGYGSGSGLDYGSGYGGSTGLYSPVRIDIGVLVLGAIVGLGAIIIIPKILALFATSLGAYASHTYGRSDGIQAAGVTDLLAQMDDVLTNYNIDSSSCFQKAVCAYFQAPQAKADSPSSSIMKTVLSSGLVNFMIEGSKFKRAADEGKAGADCSALYSACPFSKQNIFSGLKHLISSNNI